MILVARHFSDRSFACSGSFFLRLEIIRGCATAAFCTRNNVAFGGYLGHGEDDQLHLVSRSGLLVDVAKLSEWENEKVFAKERLRPGHFVEGVRTLSQ